MSRVRQYQSNFTIGEIDPLLRGRVDIEQYYSSVEKAKNVIFEPQGGFSRRPGLKFVGDYTSSLNVTDGIRLIPFEYSTGQTYLLVLVLNSATNILMYVYKDGVLVTGLNGGGNNFVLHTLSSNFTTLRGLSYTQNADTMVVTNRATNPFTIVRGAGDTNWTIANISFGVTGKIRAPKVLKSVYGGTVTSPTINNLGVPSGDVTLSATSGIVDVDFNGANAIQFIPVGSRIVSDNPQGFGTGEVIKHLSGTKLTMNVLIPFARTEYSTTELICEDDWVDNFSSDTGFPHTCTFH